MIVVDASVLIEFLLNTATGASVATRIRTEIAHAPMLIDLEITQVLRRQVREKKIDTVRAQDLIEDLLDLPLIRHAHESFLRRIWDLHQNFTAYDASYLALAEGLNCPLLTRDRAFKSPVHGVRVELI